MKKLLILTMLAAMLLTACGGKKDKDSAPDVSPTQSTEASLTATYKVDFEAVCSDAAVEEVIAHVKTLQPDLSDEDAKSQVNEMLNFVKAANKLGLDVTESYNAMVLNMGGDAAIASAKESGIPESYINFILASQSSVMPVFEYMEANNLLADGKDYFLENYWRAKHVLISTEGMDDAQKAEAKAKAEDVLARAKAGEDFSAMVAELSEDPGSASQPDGYVFTTGTMVKEFEDGTKNTAIGDFTLVETSYGYHVIQRLAIDETPELYEKFYEEANIALIANEENMIEFAKKTAAE